MNTRYKNTVDGVAHLVAAFNTTNLRIYVSLFCVVWTTAHYMLKDGWSPSNEWLMFLIAISSVDVAQYAAKRVTTFKPSASVVAADDAVVVQDSTQSTDIAELSNSAQKG